MNYVTVNFSFIFVFIVSISTSAAYAAPHPAEEVVKQTTISIFSEIKKNQSLIDKDVKLLHQLVNNVVLPKFDFDKMSGIVLNKYWKTANKDQKSQFTEQFRTLLVRTYADALASNADQKIKYLPVKIKNEMRVTVQTEIEQKGSFALPINYQMHLTDNQWKVYDVNIDGVSLVTNYRASFSTQIRKSSIDELIEQLTQRNLKAISQ